MTSRQAAGGWICKDNFNSCLKVQSQINRDRGIRLSELWCKSGRSSAKLGVIFSKNGWSRIIIDGVLRQCRRLYYWKCSGGKKWTIQKFLKFFSSKIYKNEWTTVVDSFYKYFAFQFDSHQLLQSHLVLRRYFHQYSSFEAPKS